CSLRIFYRSETLHPEQEALSNEGHRFLQVTCSSFLRRESTAKAHTRFISSAIVPEIGITLSLRREASHSWPSTCPERGVGRSMTAQFRQVFATDSYALWFTNEYRRSAIAGQPFAFKQKWKVVEVRWMQIISCRRFR